MYPVFAEYILQLQELALNRSRHRAVLGARAAVDAGIRVDHVLAITLADRANRAVAGAAAARDAIIINHVCHYNSPPNYLCFHLTYSSTGTRKLQDVLSISIIFRV